MRKEKYFRDRERERTVSFKIGIIGCGSVGCAIVDRLLEKNSKMSPFEAHQILISTRRPQLLEKYVKKSIIVCHDNKWVAQQADVLFLCTLPIHMAEVAAECRGFVRGILCSSLVGVPRDKLIQMFQSKLCVPMVHPAAELTRRKLSFHVPPREGVLWLKESCPLLENDESDANMMLFKHLYVSLLGNLLYQLQQQESSQNSVCLRICLFLMTGQDIQDASAIELMKDDGTNDQTSKLVEIVRKCTRSNVASLFCRHYFDVLLEWE